VLQNNRQSNKQLRQLSSQTITPLKKTTAIELRKSSHHPVTWPTQTYLLRSSGLSHSSQGHQTHHTHTTETLQTKKCHIENDTKHATIHKTKSSPDPKSLPVFVSESSGLAALDPRLWVPMGWLIFSIRVRNSYLQSLSGARVNEEWPTLKHPERPRDLQNYINERLGTLFSLAIFTSSDLQSEPLWNLS